MQALTISCGTGAARPRTGVQNNDDTTQVPWRSEAPDPATGAMCKRGSPQPPGKGLLVARQPWRDVLRDDQHNTTWQTTTITCSSSGVVHGAMGTASALSNDSLGTLTSTSAPPFQYRSWWTSSSTFDGASAPAAVLQPHSGAVDKSPKQIQTRTLEAPRPVTVQLKIDGPHLQDLPQVRGTQGCCLTMR